MQQVVAILVAGAVATTSALVGDNCPMVRRVARCCCPHTTHEDAAVTCCGGALDSKSMTASARDRQDDRGQVLGASVLVPLYVVPRCDVGSGVADPRGALAMSGAGPPLLRLRV